MITTDSKDTPSCQHVSHVAVHSSVDHRKHMHLCTRTYTSQSIWVLLFMLIALPNCFVQLIHSQCRTRSGVPMCCPRNQPNCSSFTLDTNSVTNRFHRHLSTLPWKRCFCDEHCMVTNDCCPDYKTVCQKAAIDCQVSEWGPWTECQCASGISLRRRRITQQPAAGGQTCPELEERKQCFKPGCSSRRVGRSGASVLPYLNPSAGEVAQLLPVRGDVMQMLRQHDMRWDVRRKLYLGRLIKQNRTEQPEPEPYCATYEITYANPACQTHNLLWQYNQDIKSNSYIPYRASYFSPGQSYLARRHRSLGSWGGNGNWDASGRASHSKRLLSDWGMSNTWSHVWMTHAALLTPGQHICITCYPAYIRCPAIGFPEMERRWRALRTADCQGTYRLVSGPHSQCTCGQDRASFVFV